MGQLDTEREALEVQVLGREVVLLGRRIAVALSATAAAETARRLADAAVMAMAGDMPDIQADQAKTPRDQPSQNQPSQTLAREE